MSRLRHVSLRVEEGNEALIPWAKQKLQWMWSRMKRLGLRTMAHTGFSDAGQRVTLTIVNEIGMIRITGGGFPTIVGLSDTNLEPALDPPPPCAQFDFANQKVVRRTSIIIVDDYNLLTHEELSRAVYTGETSEVSTDWSGATRCFIANLWFSRYDDHNYAYIADIGTFYLIEFAILGGAAYTLNEKVEITLP